MKKFAYFLSFICLNLVSLDVFCQNASLDIGIFNSIFASNTLEIRLQPIVKIDNKAYTGGRFTIRYPASSGVSLSVLSNPYSYFKTIVGSSTENTIGPYTYVIFNSVPGNPPIVTWNANVEQLILTLQVSGAGSNGVAFELVTDIPELQPITGLNGNYYQELNAESDIGAQRLIYHASTAVVLPVELLSFQAEKKGKTTFVSWETAHEKNLSLYGIERSADGVNFKTIGFEKPKGLNLSDKVTYYFTDAEPTFGVNYYRLYAKDLDNTITYSKIVSVDFGAGLKVKTYPNPFHETLNLQMDIEQAIKGDILIDFYDIAGKQILNKKVPAQGRSFNESLYTEDLVPGSYLIRVQAGSYIWQQKITKL